MAALNNAGPWSSQDTVLDPRRSESSYRPALPSPVVIGEITRLRKRYGSAAFATAFRFALAAKAAGLPVVEEFYMDAAIALSSRIRGHRSL
jgi:hypothetical protein